MLPKTTPVARHSEKTYTEADFATGTGNHHKIRQRLHKACYNANTGSYTRSTHLPRCALVHDSKKYACQEPSNFSSVGNVRRVRFGSFPVIIQRQNIRNLH